MHPRYEYVFCGHCIQWWNLVLFELCMLMVEACWLGRRSVVEHEGFEIRCCFLQTMYRMVGVVVIQAVNAFGGGNLATQKTIVRAMMLRKGWKQTQNLDANSMQARDRGVLASVLHRCLYAAFKASKFSCTAGKPCFWVGFFGQKRYSKLKGWGNQHRLGQFPVKTWHLSLGGLDASPHRFTPSKPTSHVTTLLVRIHPWCCLSPEVLPAMISLLIPKIHHLPMLVTIDDYSI